MNSKKAIYVMTFLLTAVLCLAPLANLFRLSYGQISPDLFTEAVGRSTLNTIVISLLVTFFSLVIGTFCAYFITRTNLACKLPLKSFLLYPYIIPSYLLAIGWIILANPSVGILNQVLPIFNIYSLGGIVFVESMFMYTFVFLNVCNVLDSMDGSLEESARMCGAKPRQIFFDVTLPLLKHTLAGSALIVFLATVSSFGVPAMIGGPGKVFVLTTQIYQFIKTGTPLAMTRAVVLSIPIIIGAFGLLYLAERLLSRHSYKTTSGKHNRKLEVNLRGWKLPVTALFFIFIFISMILPFATIVISSLMPVYGDWNLSFDNYQHVIFDPAGLTYLSIKNSFFLGAMGAIAIAGLSFFVSYFNAKTRFRLRHTLSSIAALPYATPGTILAMAMLLEFHFLPAILLLAVAYTVKYLSFGVKVMTPALASVDSSLEEASLVSGASWPKTLVTIWLPILKGAFTTTCFLVFVPLFSELTMSILLAGPGAPTIGSRLFHLQEYESPNQAAVLAVLILILVVTLNAVVKRLSRGKLGV